LRESAHQTPLPLAWRAVLTRREHEIGAAVLQGWNNRLIAAELGCAVATVKKHLQNIFDKLGLSTRGQVMAQARAQRQESTLSVSSPTQI
jgi:DNA-binding NarL/FixJ family response regulator